MREMLVTTRSGRTVDLAPYHNQVWKLVYHAYVPGYDPEDLYQIGMLELIKTAQRDYPLSPSLVTTTIKRQICDYLYKTTGYRRKEKGESYSTTIMTDKIENYSNDTFNPNMWDLIDFLKGFDYQTQKVIAYSLLGYKNKEIAKLLGVSEGRISQILKKARKDFDENY